MRGFPSSPASRWLIGGALAVLAMLALVLRFLSDDPGPDAAGQVKITSSAPAPTVRPPAAEAPMKPIPLQPTRSNGRTAEAEASTVLVEKRDRDWAPRSEAAITRFIRSLPAIGYNGYLKIKCATSACEVTGIASPDAATGSMAPVWKALERDTASAGLRKHGLERTAAIFDTGRSGDEFKIYYRRTLVAAGQ